VCHEIGNVLEYAIPQNWDITCEYGFERDMGPCPGAPPDAVFSAETKALDKHRAATLAFAGLSGGRAVRSRPSSAQGGLQTKMRFLAIAISVLPGLAMAEPLTLTDVINAEAWVFEDARCSDVVPLFTTPTADMDDLSEVVSIRLLFASTLMQGAAMERGVSYGALVLEWGAFCTENPNSDWLDFLRP
jgi:hypothetical protein